MKIETIKINDLKPLEQNVRKHNEKQIAELTKSVEQFGQTRAIVVDEDNNILIGNGLYIALKTMGKDTCDIHRMVGLSEKDKKKLILADNKIFSLGVDDYEGIEKYINDITMDGTFDIPGFDEEVLKQMTMSMEETVKEIENYGVVTDEKLTTENKPLEDTPREDNAPEAEDLPTSPTSSIEQVATPNNKVERKSIICPNCGEVIYLD